jgi:hypothetical protein
MADVQRLNLQRESWGPRFWTILHTLAEQSGHQQGPVLNNDEADAWGILLKAQVNIMPCALCKKHFQEWLNTHRLDGLHSKFEEERRDWLRQWVYDCHDRVNVLNGKMSPPLSDIPALYPKRNLQTEMAELATMFQLALTRNQLQFDDVQRWKYAANRLRRLVGV